MTYPVCVPAGMASVSSPSRVSNDHCRAERGLGHRHVEVGGQVRPLADEAVVGSHRQVHVQVTRRTAPVPGRAASGEPERAAVVDAGGDVDVERARLDAPTLAPTLGHGLAMVSPCPPQRPQGTAVTTWPRMDWRTRRNSPEPWHPGQRTAVVPCRAPLPSHSSQATDSSTERSRATPKTASRKASSMTTSASVPRPGPAGGPPIPAPPKKASKRSPSPPPPKKSPPASGIDTFGPEAVVAGATLGVAQHLVGLRDLLEPRFGLRVTAGAVWVQLAGPAAVSALDLLVVGAAADAEQGVVVSRHRRPTLLVRSVGASRWAPSCSPTTCTAAKRAGVVHPGRPEDADGAGHLSVDRDRGDDQRARRQRFEAVLGADGHRQATVEHFLDELHHDELLLEDGEDRAHGVDGVEGGGHVRGPAHEDVLGLGAPTSWRTRPRPAGQRVGRVVAGGLVGTACRARGRASRREPGRRRR